MPAVLSGNKNTYVEITVLTIFLEFLLDVKRSYIVFWVIYNCVIDLRSITNFVKYSTCICRECATYRGAC